jgi:hypothetical protein
MKKLDKELQKEEERSHTFFFLSPPSKSTSKDVMVPLVGSVGPSLVNADNYLPTIHAQEILWPKVLILLIYIRKMIILLYIILICFISTFHIL